MGERDRGKDKRRVRGCEEDCKRGGKPITTHCYKVSKFMKMGVALWFRNYYRFLESLVWNDVSSLWWFLVTRTMMPKTPHELSKLNHLVSSPDRYSYPHFLTS